MHSRGAGAELEACWRWPRHSLPYEAAPTVQAVDSGDLVIQDCLTRFGATENTVTEPIRARAR